MTLAADIIRHIETSFTVQSGVGAGAPMRLMPWQKRFVRAAVKHPVSALSVSRGNGKSGLCSALAAACLPGAPWARPGADVVLVAASFSQARIVFDDLVAQIPDPRKNGWRLTQSANRAEGVHRGTGIKLKAIGHNPRTAHGLRPAICILDEPAQWQPTQRDAMFSAVRTATGKVPDARLVAIGTRSSDTDHWFSKLLERSIECHSMQYSASKDDPIRHVSTWRKANPALDVFPDLRAAIEQEARDAVRDPALESQFRALRLNAGVADVWFEPLIDAHSWQAYAERTTTEWPSTGTIWALDLGGSQSMSVVCAHDPASGSTRLLGSFPRVPSLADRERKDGKRAGLYQTIADRGELILTGERTVDFCELLRAARDRFGLPCKMLADRWRLDELRDAASAVGMLVPVEGRGQGFYDSGDDIRRFQLAVTRGEVRCGKSLLARQGLSDAKIQRDHAGNARLWKREGYRHSRDDAAVSLVMGVAEGDRIRQRELSNAGLGDLVLA